jgi:prepilin-type N-terminal cleavage/methylation domain-containing protein
MELIKRAKRLYKALLTSNKERKGFTLPEVAAVVAITGTLAAIVVPVAVDQIEKGRQARAAMDVDGISQALNGFFRDTGEWPDRVDENTPNGVEVLRSGGTNATWNFGSTPDITEGGANEGNVEDPATGTGLGWGAGTADALVNHLTLDEAGYVDAGVNWNGPYMPQIFNDPWGRNYLVYAKAFTVTDDGTDDIFVWVISAGPNETLETSVTSPILNNATITDGSVSTTADDIGKMIFKAREGVLGVQ